MSHGCCLSSMKEGGHVNSSIAEFRGCVCVFFVLQMVLQHMLALCSDSTIQWQKWTLVYLGKQGMLGFIYFSRTKLPALVFEF